MDMEKKVKILLKELQSNANKAMQQEFIWIFINVKYRLENRQSQKNIKMVYQIFVYKTTKEQCWLYLLSFWNMVYTIFHKPTATEH